MASNSRPVVSAGATLLPKWTQPVFEGAGRSAFLGKDRW